MNLNHHPGLAMGPMPIRMVTGHGAGPHVGIGIGLPIMAAQMPTNVHQPQLPNTPTSSQNKLVLPDSSDDRIDKSNRLHHQQSPSSSVQPLTQNISQHGLPWAGQMLQPITGMGYPLMGMSVMGEPNVLYGINLISAQNQNIHGGPPEGNIQSMSSPASVASGSATCVSQSQINGTPSTSLNSDSTLSQLRKSNANKEIIHCKSCTLFPPNPSAPPPTTRDKPPGCRTVFVGGLPENASEDTAREIFERCGEITTIRMSKKNFCHIRFELESFVENAIYLSGYRVRIGSNSDAINIGRLHVDYAQARDDLYEWECRQRQLLREQRHRERLEQERLLPPSPPPIVHYSEHEAINLSERLKVDDSYMKGIHVLMAWLDRGDCNKRNANTFYSMIQLTNSHVRRLLGEKSQYDEDLQKAKELARQRMQGLLMQFGQIEKVFIASCHKKAWDHFTKAQRKNIETWRKQTIEIKNLHLDEVLNYRTDEEMDLSDSESDREQNKTSNVTPRSKRIRLDDDSAVSKLKEENDALRCQLEAFKNEVDLIKADLKTDLEEKDRQINVLQQKLVEIGRKNSVTSSSPVHSDSEDSCKGDNQISNGILRGRKLTPEKCDSSTLHLSQNSDESAIQTLLQITEIEARLIGIISTFLLVHPFGASLDYIWSYTQKVFPSVRAEHIQNLFSKVPSLFKEQLTGVGATFERKWVFVGFCGSELVQNRNCIV